MISRSGHSDPVLQTAGISVLGERPLRRQDASRAIRQRTLEHEQPGVRARQSTRALRRQAVRTDRDVDMGKRVVEDERRGPSAASACPVQPLREGAKQLQCEEGTRIRGATGTAADHQSVGGMSQARRVAVRSSTWAVRRPGSSSGGIATGEHRSVIPCSRAANDTALAPNADSVTIRSARGKTSARSDPKGTCAART